MYTVCLVHKFVHGQKLQIPNRALIMLISESIFDNYMKLAPERRLDIVDR